MFTDSHFSPDELTLLTVSKDGTIIAWNTTTGNQRFTCEGHQQGIQVLVSYQKFHVVAHNLDETQDLKAECKAYLSEGVRLADWNDILAYYREGGSMADFITELKIPIGVCSSRGYGSHPEHRLSYFKER